MRLIIDAGRGSDKASGNGYVEKELTLPAAASSRTVEKIQSGYDPGTGHDFKPRSPGGDSEG